MSELRTYDVIMTPTADGPWILKSEADKELRRQKYKRCLKNREICVMRCDIEFARQYPTRGHFWMKWERKWLVLAEKFKPNN